MTSSIKELDFSPMWSTVHQITLNPVNMGINFKKSQNNCRKYNNFYNKCYQL